MEADFWQELGPCNCSHCQLPAPSLASGSPDSHKDILKKYLCPSFWLLKQSAPKELEFLPEMSCWEKKNNQTWCQPEGKLVSQEGISHSSDN